MSSVERTSEPQLLSSGNARDLIDSVEAFLFDCDGILHFLFPLPSSLMFTRWHVFVFDRLGVIWKGDKLIDGVVDTLEMLRSKVHFSLSYYDHSNHGFLFPTGSVVHL